MEIRQQDLWRSVAPAVKSQYVLHTADQVWAALLDLSTLDISDHIRLTVEIELLGPRPGDEANAAAEDHVDWAISEEYNVHFQVTGGRRLLFVNDAALGPQHVVLIEPAAGPWRSRLIYEQLQGVNKPIRYLVW